MARKPLSIHPLTPDRWCDLETLFGERGACGGCWCMYWLVSHAEFERGKGERNRQALRRRVISGEQPGLLAYAGSEPVGWCAVGPRERYVRLRTSRILAPVDDAPVWSVACLFVRREHRRRGLSRRLIREAVRFARSRGARCLEAYPVEPKPGRVADAFLWHGVASSFLAEGFREVERRSPTRPIVRRGLRPAR